MAKSNKGKIIAAVGAATNGKTPNAKRIEQAMSAAVTKAMAAGITDPDEIRRMMLEAAAQARKPPA